MFAAAAAKASSSANLQHPSGNKNVPSLYSFAIIMSPLSVKSNVERFGRQTPLRNRSKSQGETVTAFIRSSCKLTPRCITPTWYQRNCTGYSIFYGVGTGGFAPSVPVPNVLVVFDKLLVLMGFPLASYRY